MSFLYPLMKLSVLILLELVNAAFNLIENAWSIRSILWQIISYHYVDYHGFTMKNERSKLLY